MLRYVYMPALIFNILGSGKKKGNLQSNLIYLLKH